MPSGWGAESREDVGDRGIRIPLLDLLAAAKPLSHSEAKKTRETVIKAFAKYAELADDAIPILSRSGKPVDELPSGGIWSTLEAHELEVLADAWLDVAKHWAPAAVVVRGVVRTYSYLEVGMITGPRFMQTIRYYVREGIGINFRVMLGRGE